MITAFRIVSNDLTGRTMSISTEPKNRVGFVGSVLVLPVTIAFPYAAFALRIYWNVH